MSLYRMHNMPYDRVAQTGVLDTSGTYGVVTLTAGGTIDKYNTFSAANVVNGVYSFLLVSNNSEATTVLFSGTLSGSTITELEWPPGNYELLNLSGTAGFDGPCKIYMVLSAEIINQIDSQLPKVLTYASNTFSLGTVHYNRTIIFTSSDPVTVSVPNNCPVNCFIVQAGTGTVSVFPSGGTLNGAMTGIALSARYKAAMITNDYVPSVGGYTGSWLSQ